MIYPNNSNHCGGERYKTSASRQAQAYCRRLCQADLWVEMKRRPIAVMQRFSSHSCNSNNISGQSQKHHERCRYIHSCSGIHGLWAQALYDPCLTRRYVGTRGKQSFTANVRPIAALYLQAYYRPVQSIRRIGLLGTIQAQVQIGLILVLFVYYKTSNMHSWLEVMIAGQSCIHRAIAWFSVSPAG